MRQPARRPGDSCPDRHPPQPRRGRAPGAKTDTSNAQSNPKSTSYHHRGKPFGLTKRASRKRPNPCRNPISAGPASSLYVSCGPCSSVPASGCHHRPVPGCRPSKAAAPGHGKLGRNSRVTLSGRSADNLEPQRPARAFPDAINSPTATYQSPTTNPSERSRLPHENFPPPNRPPAARRNRPGNRNIHANQGAPVN